jgi:hypothetical protein
MAIDEGSSSNFVQHARNNELAVIDPNGKEGEVVTVVPSSLLKKAKPGKSIEDDRLPFDIDVVQYMVNASLAKADSTDNPADQGAGLTIRAVEQSEAAGVDTKQNVETPAAYLRLTDRKTGKDLGTFLFSARLNSQSVRVGDKSYEVALRPKRTYKPFSLHLLKFSFDRYPGTSTPKNYSSLVRLVDKEKGTDREVLIRMNEPMRYRGDAYFQADFDKKTEKTTYLQVVRNPGWLMPYISCAVVAFGMVVHFGMTLVIFLVRRMTP